MMCQICALREAIKKISIWNRRENKSKTYDVCEECYNTMN